MKKSLIALAVLGAMSSAASAQSSVTIYGIFDIGVQWNEFGVATGVATPLLYKRSTNHKYQSTNQYTKHICPAERPRRSCPGPAPAPAAAASGPASA